MLLEKGRFLDLPTPLFVIPTPGSHLSSPNRFAFTIKNLALDATMDEATRRASARQKICDGLMKDIAKWAPDDENYGEWLSKQDALGLIESISVSPIVIGRRSNPDDTTTLWNVYFDTPLSPWPNYDWATLMRSTVYRTKNGSTGKTCRTKFLCHHCKNTDHPSGLCPLA